MATFRKRGNKWQAQVRLQGCKPVSRSFTLKSDAQAWARQTEAAIERGHNPAPASPTRSLTLAELIVRYAMTVTPGKKGRASEGFRLRVLRRHPISRLLLSEITAATIAAYRDDRLQTVSPSSVRRELAVLQHCLEIARRDWGVALNENPVAEITKPSQGRARERRVTAQELTRLRDALRSSRNPLLANVIHFAIHTGMRRGEILSLRWADIDWEVRTAYLADTKNGHPRTVPLSKPAISAIPERPPEATDADRVFPLSANALRLAWERLKGRASIEDLRFHDLRHEAISRFFEQGLSVPEVSLISGHRDARMLLRYTHLKAADVAERLHSLKTPALS